MQAIIDLRSDTVTEPTEAMRRAMAQAKVGDDYYGEDPTIKRLEAFAAEILGKEAGLFVTSGTMGNLVSIMTHTQRSDGVIMEENAHCYHNENGNTAVIAGVLPLPVPGKLGVIHPESVVDNMRGSEVLHSRTRLICIENTHNVAGGTVWPLADLISIREVADRFNLAIHIDGARVFNAAVALGVAPAKIANFGDSVTFCLTKGLGCPYGSLIAGDSEFIIEARRNRQMVGGGLRQGGVVAAAGIVALESMIKRLAEDHNNAKALANGLVELGLKVDLEAVQSNMVYVELSGSSKISPVELVQQLRKDGIWINTPFKSRMRFVTHYGVEEKHITYTLKAIERALSN
ncbi:aminotransferase class I/II-fold pyridoxal phosphate-dependent enzyme [Candidatus Acetothermia bacterium]|nr:aminotransferase class I/II-fold pyridoxal phosphate-dependent enzyme [Candidatus Acetothermia bacterium]MBI3643499.1 aminotransferase class I/II-fold pyridoxal phosphate-dependent enzyme [Candidatus Acetothermia bacterium]